MEQLQQISELQRDVAVLDVEVQNFKKVMERLDEAISSMSRISTNIERLLIVHEERIKTNDTNLANHKNSVDDTFVSVKSRLLQLEDHRRTIEATTPDRRITKLEEKVENMFKWRWQLMGGWAVILVIITALAKALHLW
jgi:predicted  nucleic acid-binding Zn-ribbon protein